MGRAQPRVPLSRNVSKSARCCRLQVNDCRRVETQQGKRVLSLSRVWQSHGVQPAGAGTQLLGLTNPRAKLFWKKCRVEGLRAGCLLPGPAPRFLRHVQLGSLQLLFEEPHPRAEGGCRLSREEKVFWHLPQHIAAIPRPPAKKEELPWQEFPLKLSNEGLKTKMKKNTVNSVCSQFQI